MNNVYNPQGFYPQQYGAYAPYQQIQQQRFQPQEQYQAMQNQQAIGLNGRIVQVVENINANEVPMDGSMAFFPKQDLSEIYVKGWNADGTIKTIVYKPQIDNKSVQAVNSSFDTEKLKIDLSDESTAVFMQKFDEIFNKFDELENKMCKSSTSQRKTSTLKKEGDGE